MRKIIIIGAGVSGLYLANLLEKNGNYDYKILEKKSNLSIDQGYGVQLSVNGVKLLNNIGFKSLAIHDLNFPRNVNFYDAKNCKFIAGIKISKFNYKDAFYTTLKRSVLIDFLLKKIPKEKILFNSDIESIEQNSSFKVNFKSKKNETADYLAICDGVFSKTKDMVIHNKNKIKFFKSVALRGTLDNIVSSDISLYLGPNFHFVIYPVNQNNESNFVAIIREKNFNKINTMDKNELKENFLNLIFKKSEYNLKNNLKNISLYPVYVSKKFITPQNNKIFLAGDALYTYPPSFAQGASQSIETSNDIYKNLVFGENNYYKNIELNISKLKSRSYFNHFAFHVSNPIIVFTRNLFLKYLTKNNLFLDSYLGKIYK